MWGESAHETKMLLQPVLCLACVLIQCKHEVVARRITLFVDGLASYQSTICCSHNLCLFDLRMSRQEINSIEATFSELKDIERHEKNCKTRTNRRANCPINHCKWTGRSRDAFRKHCISKHEQNSPRYIHVIRCKYIF